MKLKDLKDLKDGKDGKRVARGLMELANFRCVDMGGAAASAEVSSPFAALGYKPDPWKMYVEFDICHSLPVKIGPVESFNYIGYFPDTLAASHASLLHQQFNLGHKLKAYSPKQVSGASRPEVARDRIIGCIVATAFPNAPAQGWISPKNPQGGTACIRALAVVFKLAEGVAQVMGAHLTSRQKQSVSIECITNLGNIGVLIPSKMEVCPLLEPTDGVLSAMTEPATDGLLPHIGKLNGEQLVVVYGMGAPVSFRGVGMTPQPAEKPAKIVSVSAEQGGGQLMAIAAEEVSGAVVGQSVRFTSGRVGKIEALHTKTTRLPGASWSMPATAEDPVLEIVMPDKKRVLRRARDVADGIGAP